MTIRTIVLALVAVVIFAFAANEAKAEVYASHVRITQEGTTDPFDGSFGDRTGAAIRFYLNDAADSVVINVVPSGGGTALKTITAAGLSAGDNSVLWDGSDNGGSPTPAATYDVEITAYGSGYSTYTVYHNSTPAIFTRGVGSVNNPALKQFGFIYAASNGGYATGVARHASDGSQYGDIPGNALVTTTGVPVGPANRRYATLPDDDGYVYLIGRDAGRIYRYNLDTLDVQEFDTSAYGTIIQGLDFKGTGASKYLYVTGDNSVFGIPIGNQSFNTAPLETLVVVDTGRGMLLWDAEWGSDNSLYVIFRADSALGQYTNRPRGVMKFDMSSGTLPKTIADTVWTTIMADGDPVTLALDEGGAGAGDDILYMSHDVGSPNVELSGVYAFTGLNTSAPTRAVAWADPDNNTTSFRGAIATDALGNVIYFENSNEHVTLISPPGGPNSYTYTGFDPVTVSVAGVTPPLLTIAEARIDMNGDRQPDRVGDTVKVIGIVNSVNIQTTNFGYFIQDATGGIEVFQFGLLGAPTLNVGDRIQVIGAVAYFRGTTEISPLDLAADITLIDTGNVITPIDLTIGEFKANAEQYESMQIRLNVAHPLDFTSAQWPAAGSSANLNIWDGIDTLIMRIDSDTEVDGSPYPTFPVRLTGIASQFTSSASTHDDGYQTTPMFNSQFVPIDAPPVNNFKLLTPANNSSITIDSAANYQFTWNTALDFNGDALIYQFKPVAFSGSLSDNAGADTIKTVSGATLLGYLGGSGSLQFKWTVLAKDPANPPVPTVDTFTVTIQRQIPPPPLGWTVQTSGTTQQLRSVKALDRFNAWIGGGSGTVLRTTDGGNTWTSVGGGVIGSNTIFSIDALDENTAYVTTSPSNAFIFRTTNGGTSWDTVFTQVGGFINAIKMFDANNGFAMGDPVGGVWTILGTTDGGATWAQSPTAPVQVGTEAGWNTSLSAISATHIWFGTSNSGVYYTTDGGLTWGFGATSFASSVGVGFADAQYGVAGGSSATGAARTTDGGVTWTTTTLPGTGSIYGVQGRGLDFWAVRGTLVYHSADRGANWDTSFAGSIGSFRHADFALDGSDTYGWAVTSTGGIASFYGILTGVDDDAEQAVPQSFTLDQNFPNPFNPSTTIRYSIPQASSIRLTVYNLLGQEIAVLQDQVQEVGFYNLQWRGTNKFGQQVASGVYFYHLQARPLDGSQPFTSFKKMVFMK